MRLPTFEDVESGAERIAGVAHRTPTFTSRTFDRLTGTTTFFKAESFQRAGAFKFRGAYNALSRLDEEQRSNGVLTFSSGNHAAALSLAGRILDIAVTIVMPRDAPKVKLEATKGYGGKIIVYDRSETTREQLAQRLAEEQGLLIIPPYDHPDIVAGAGTAAKELIEERGDLDFLVVPCGGGGLLSGSALSARSMCRDCQVIGVEPQAGDDGLRSFRSGSLLSIENPVTIADGARTPSLGPKVTFPLIKKLVHDFVTVDDDQIAEATVFLWERMKLVAEPTGALAAAALLSGRLDARGKRVGVLISGGNLDCSGLLSR